MKKVAVIGAGWAGCAAAVEATRQGNAVTLYDSARIAGGRARRVDSQLNGEAIALDNGQHILIGAYAETLRLMRDLDIDTDAALLRLPLTLQFPDGAGLKLPDWPAPFDALAGILGARGWTLTDKWSTLKSAVRWQLSGFNCAPSLTVSELCNTLSPGAMAQLIEPLCISALNTPANRASAQVFLRVLRDAMFAESRGSNLLLPRLDLGGLLPDAAIEFMEAHKGEVQLGTRVQGLTATDTGWAVESDGNATFDAVILACPPPEAARLAESSGSAPADWLTQARGLAYEAITTVYAHAPGARLHLPMLALHNSAEAPAQFVFDRGQLEGPAGLLAFVVSASEGDAATLTRQVIAQANHQLGLALTPVQTIVEKRATFACTPGLVRPGADIAEGLFACGDYVEGPYPATLEGAVRSGLDAARRLR